MGLKLVFTQREGVSEQVTDNVWTSDGKQQDDEENYITRS
jgi:hypothetical protein